MKTTMKTILLAGAAMAMATSAGAATVVYNFGAIATTAALTTGDLGQSATYTLSGLSVGAAAFGPSSDHLYGKSLGGDEVGLGMTNDPTGQHEIAYGQGFVQLDLNALFGKVLANSIFAAFNSTTGGEQWTIYGSNTAGTVGSATLPTLKTLISNGPTENVNTLLTGGFRYYDFVSTVPLGGASGGNVLLKSLTVTQVPEPETWALMIAGFGGIGAALRRRRTQVTVATA